MDGAKLAGADFTAALRAREYVLYWFEPAANGNEYLTRPYGSAACSYRDDAREV
jgi:hypothetical protein